MCGIVGGYGLSVEDARRASHSLSHRGPDSSGFFSDGGVILAHRRLSIIDPVDGHQPMSDEFGNSVVFNGEIYNFIELRDELVSSGFSFKTSSDTEVLLTSYRKWGRSFVERLNGMFAVCIYDSQANIFYLARDRFGEKPLYYTSCEGKFAFASDLDALLLCRVGSPQTNVLALQKYLAYGYFPSPFTPLRGVFKLDAGQALEYQIGGSVEDPHNYWSPELKSCVESFDGRSHQRSVEEFGTLLLEATRLRLRSDVPVGLFLSGGLDSTAIGAAIRKLEPELEINSFSLGFDHRSYNESDWAAIVAKHFGFAHHSKTVSAGDLAAAAIPVLSKMAEPIADPSLIPTSIVSELARGTVKVVLTGDGGDELLAGYDTVKALRLASMVDALPKSIPSFASNLIRILPASNSNLPLRFKMQQFLRGFGHDKSCRMPLWMSVTPLDDIVRLTGSPLDVSEAFSEFYSPHSSGSDLDELQLFYLKSYLKDGVLAKVDRATMMFGLEARSAFLDPNLAAFCFELPGSLKYHQGKTKVVLRKWLEDSVPAAVVKRPKKGFGIPLGQTISEIDMRLGLDNFRCLDLDESRLLFSSFRRGSKDVDPRVIFALLALASSPVTGPLVH